MQSLRSGSRNRMSCGRFRTKLEVHGSDRPPVLIPSRGEHGGMPPRQVQNIAEHEAQEKRRGWTTSIDTHRMLKCAVAAGHRAADQVRFRDAPPKEFGELQNTPCRHQPPPPLGHGQPSNRLRGLGSSAFHLPLQMAVRSGVGMPTREAFRTLQYVAGVHKPLPWAHRMVART